MHATDCSNNGNHLDTSARPPATKPPALPPHPDWRTPDPAVCIRRARETVKKQLAYLHPTYKRILNPHIYKVSITEKLKDLKLQFISERIK